MDTAPTFKVGANLLFRKGAMTGAHCRQHSAVNLNTAVENKTQALRFQIKSQINYKGLIQK